MKLLSLKRAMEPTVGSIRQVNIQQEMREAYLDYAMSVIVARALPDARDGLKPVHRRILYAMHELGIRADTPFKKCARIVGEVLGKYHPHGDSAVYEALVRLAQDFAMRYPLIDGQGNFGSIDGDGAAAMRYTEARMAEIGDELLVDIDKDTVNFVENFDGTLTEPSVLPCSIPNLLVNGSSGIAVGMSTNIPPHNLGETCDALMYMLQHWEQYDDISIQDLMQYVKGPDFPTGGLIYHHSDSDDAEESSLESAYATGRGKIIMRAKVHIEDIGRGKSRIIVSELPYQTNKSALIERIANLARDGRIEGLADLRDESDRQGLRLMIELQRGADPVKVLAQLFRLTPLQETFSIIMLALVNNEPRHLSLKQALRVFIDHRLEVIRRRSEYDLERNRARAHILEGLIKALDMLDQVIATIRKSRTPDSARNNLIALLKITDIQARAILDMQLRRLAQLERKQITDEYDEKLKLIGYLEGLLASPQKMRDVIGEELATIKQAYAQPRRSVIIAGSVSSTPADALHMPSERTWVTLTAGGKLARSFEAKAPRVTSDWNDAPRALLESTTDQLVYLFTTDGMGTTVPVHQLPQANSADEGQPFANVTSLSADQQIAAALTLPATLEDGYVVFATRNGEVKRLRTADLPGMTANAFKVIDLDAGDALGWVLVTDGDAEIVLVTSDAAAIRFRESDVRPTGLGAGGMRGIKLAERAQVIGAALAQADGLLITVTEDGIAKSSLLKEYPAQGRAGGGVIAMKLPTADSRLSAACVVSGPNEAFVLLTGKGKFKHMKASAVPAAKRAGKGDYVLSVNARDRVQELVLFTPLRELPNGEAVETTSATA
jgi:DNA gyrase subunit A